MLVVLPGWYAHYTMRGTALVLLRYTPMVLPYIAAWLCIVLCSIGMHVYSIHSADLRRWVHRCIIAGHGGCRGAKVDQGSG